MGKGIINTYHYRQLLCLSVHFSLFFGVYFLLVVGSLAVSTAANRCLE